MTFQEIIPHTALITSVLVNMTGAMMLASAFQGSMKTGLVQTAASVPLLTAGTLMAYSAFVKAIDAPRIRRHPQSPHSDSWFNGLRQDQQAGPGRPGGMKEG